MRRNFVAENAGPALIFAEMTLGRGQGTAFDYLTVE